mmetsp:Transcript_7879/g.14195  ORF Transcript_7879/g.14195 Transcript_7879/m.14195 type:complete len:319 (-) Transcript_7879:240-1196(-)
MYHSTYDAGAVDRPHEELCSLFTSTISSLASDAEALRSISSLTVAAGLNSRDTNILVDENINPNMPVSNQNDQQAKALIGSLRNLDKSVADLEKQVFVLREVLSDERRAIEELEAVKEQTEAQRGYLEQISQGCIGLRLPGEERVEPNTGMNRENERSAKQARPSASMPQETKENIRFSEISIALVTESELNSISRNVRGRIHLAVLNDAVTDIQRVCRRKYSVLSRSTKQVNKQGKSRHSKSEYQKRLSAHRSIEVDEHEGNPWVSEQDLRDSCAFFRSGESTARSILLVLRTLKRLKQIPGRNSKITYICLSPSNQ